MDNYVGKRIDGRYELHEIIGVGGMAVVYKAYDNIDDRTVAVKILKDEYLANEEFRRRFKNESKAIAVLSHPNIVKVFDVSFGDRLQYIVMEYIEGITLKEYIEQQKVINYKEAVHFLTQILRALQHAHDKGIVHRDVKPQNIILLQNGTIKVTDFGIASFSRSDTRTMTDSAIGSVHYISPEQARGETADARADIYSVGVVMYEMLTGQLPFQSDSAVSVAVMQLQQDAVRPREINDNIPIGLEQITMHAMEKDAKERYQSAAEMLLDLEEFKRNPAIKFDYSYFVDNEPTKYIDRTMTHKTPVVQPIAQPEYTEPEDDEAAASSNKLIPIVTGIIIGLVAVLVLVGGYLFFFTDTFNSGDKIEVPNFVNLNYNDDILANPDDYSKYNFELEYEYNNQKDFGVIIKQDPEKGRKINPDDKIKLTINSNGKLVTVPDVYGDEYLSANQTLKNSGFQTSYQFEYSLTVDEGKVVRTEPERNSEAPESSNVIIFLSTHEDQNAVECPNLLDKDLETARLLAESVELSIDENVVQEDSEKAAGTVISQTPEPGTPISKGAKISIVVSNGVAPSSSATIFIQLPNRSGMEGELKVYVNNACYEQATANVLMNGSSYSFPITGSGSSNSLIVKINGSDVYSCNVDFTKVPAVLTNVRNYDYYVQSTTVSDSSTIPDTTSLDEESAKALLREYGFNNVTVEYQTMIGNRNVGIVIEQSPNPTGLDKLRKYPLSTEIHLIVGKSMF